MEDSFKDKVFHLLNKKEYLDEIEDDSSKIFENVSADVKKRKDYFEFVKQKQSLEHSK